MTPAQRTAYHAQLWPAACAAQGWTALPKAEREQIRRDVTRTCCTLIGVPARDSSTDLDEHEVTALFCYLKHLAEPDSVLVAHAWDECMRDHIAFNMSRQADWYQARTYGRTGAPRLARERFQGRATAAGSTFERPLTRDEAEQRLLTMRARAREAGALKRPRKKPARQKEAAHAQPF